MANYKEITKKEFKKLSKLERIERVIHDGQYYTVEKWSKVALVDEKEIRQYIKKNKNKLIELNGSYRLPYNNIIEWYEKNNLDITEQIVPKNFPPRLVEKKTEAEWFESNPRELCAYLVGKRLDEYTVDKLQKILLGDARVISSRSDRVYIHCLSPKHIMATLQKHFSREELKNMHFRMREGVYTRELTKFNDLDLNNMVMFYSLYLKSLLQSQMNTILVYLNNDDVDGQFYEWIMEAMQKFDERQGVPFIGYLSSVIPRWVYNLTDDALGIELSGFGRRRSKAIEELTSNQESLNISKKDIADYMKMELEEYLKLENDLINWQNQKTPVNLVFEETGQERNNSMMNFKYKKSTTTSIQNINKLSLSILKSAVKTKDYKSAIVIIENMGKDNIDTVNLNNTSNEFKEEFRKVLLNG